MRTGTMRFVVIVAALLLAGCASSGKLAKQSHEQLLEGDPRRAYETALRAVAKDPYNANATAALRASGQAVLGHEARRFRSLLATADTTGAAETSLGMDELRHTVAGYGVTLVTDERLAADERRVRAAAAGAAAAEGDALFDDGHPKPACAAYERARRFEPDNARWASALAEARAEATDRVLLMPYVCDTRARVDARRLSDDMFASVTRYARSHLEFTELADPGLVWSRLFRAGPAAVTREAASILGQEREATRVAWSRIHGDRIESHSETFSETLYRKVRTRQPDGTTATTWEAVPVRVRVEDRWVSVALECEVYAVAERRIVARRSTDHGAGLRVVSVTTPLAGDAADYALFTPEMWAGERDACRARNEAWTAALGSLTVEGLVTYARGSGRTGGRSATAPAMARHGHATRLGRDYDVCYGSLPGESTLMQEALAEAWRELAAVLEESDRT
jgi:hypothetical protein